MRPFFLAKLFSAIRLLRKNPRYFLLRTRQHIAFGKSTLPTYAEWLSDQLLIRIHNYPLPLTPTSFSILTTIYEKTDAFLLQETAESIFAQTCPFHEWLILAHGPVSEGVNKVLMHLELQSHVLVYRLTHNLGIMGGMKFCLDRASGDYIVPMDADDLITQDALQIMAATIERNERPAILYSDEDMLIKGEFTAPYFRTDWDPVLNLAGSYIWHLCAFRHDLATKLHVYTDIGGNWCHDWDTIFRFSNAGYIPFHVSEILYHWRQHSASSTNRADPDSGSMRSTRDLLEKQIALHPNPDRYKIERYPIGWRNKEWYIKRCPYMGLTMDIIVVARNSRSALRTLKSVLQNTNYPFGSVIVCLDEMIEDKLRTRFEMSFADTSIDKVNAKVNIQFVSNTGLDGIKIAGSKVTSPLILFCSDAIEVGDNIWPWEALKLMEFHDDVAMVGGRLIKGNCIYDGGKYFEEDGQLVCHDRGQFANDSGYFSLSLRPHTVNALPLDFFVTRSDFFTSAISSFPDIVQVNHLPKWLGAAALENKLRVAFSPLISVNVKENTLDSIVKENTNGAEYENFMFLYGQKVKGQQLSSSYYTRYEKSFSNYT